MKKNLLLSSMTILLLLVSCRTEDTFIQQKQEKDMRFSAFVSQNGEAVDYGKGFEYLIKRYDSIHKTNLSAIANKTLNLHASTKSVSNSYISEPHIEFNVRSKLITEENGDKWMVFPVIKNNDVVGLIGAILTNNETAINYSEIDQNSDFYKNNIQGFKVGLSNFHKNNSERKLNTIARVKSDRINLMSVIGDPDEEKKNTLDKEDKIPVFNPKKHCNNPNDMVTCKNIEEVVLYKYKKLGSPSWFPIQSAMSRGYLLILDQRLRQRGECLMYFDCNYIPKRLTTRVTLTGDEWASRHINDNGLKDNKCANDVYKTLKSKVGLFNNLLDNFKGSSSILNLSFNIKPISAPPGFFTTGHTDFANIKNGYISITLNPDALGSTDLGIATTFIHEMIHAKMIHDLVNAGWDGDKSLRELNPESLPTLLKAYQEYKFSYNKGEDAQHKFMSEYYIPKMVSALGQFDGYSHSKADYENLAWTGLQKTDAFNALSQAKKNKITEANNTFNRKAPCGK